MGYRSGLEREVAEYLPECDHEPFVVKYHAPKKYTPDFVHPNNTRIWYEVKGYFRTHDEAKKYIHIQESYPHVEIRFIIKNPDIRAYPGVKLTMGEWLTKNGFKWSTVEDIPDEWKRGE